MTISARRAAATVSLAALLAFAGTGRAAPSGLQRVVFLGFDGASADTVERLMAAGKLPNLEALGHRGGYTRLAPSNPAQSPVSWATITTGWNPGKTGIYDFLRRKSNASGTNLDISIALAEADPSPWHPISTGGRAALVFGAGAAGAAAGVGIVLALYAGKRRKKRPHGVLQGTATGVAFLFAGAAYVVLGWVPESVDHARNLRSGEPFWQTLDKKGVRCIALEAPLSFPADEMTCGCCLSGLGVPDVSGSWGTFAVWTDDPTVPAKTETGGVSYFVEPGAGKFDLVIAGPPLPMADAGAVAAARDAEGQESRHREMAYEWTPVKRRASETREALSHLVSTKTATTHLAARIEYGKSLHLSGDDGVSVDLTPGVWSDLVPVSFRLTPLVKLGARVRFLLTSAGSASTKGGVPWTPFSLFVAPVQFDPAKLPPNVQIASPMSFAADLARSVGPFETIGWPELTNPVKDDVLADREFLAQVDLVRKSREKRLMDQIERNDWDCIFALFSEPDRVQHAFFRHVDPKSPLHDPKAAAKFGGEIDRTYLEMDRLVGEVIAKAGLKTQVFVCSDHGFAPFRRGVNINNLLMKNGLQVRSLGSGPSFLDDLRNHGTSPFFPGIDWGETKAYAMGLGNVYLNLKGREPHGIVDPADSEKVLAEIEAKLVALTDVHGEKAVHRVYRGRDLFHGARAAEAPDLVVGFEFGYRVSWQNCLGNVDADVITDNKSRWSGDHCSVDPELVPGVFFTPVPLEAIAPAGVTDVAPTVMSMYGVEGADADGHNLLAK